jgi:hypothetical protein
VKSWKSRCHSHTESAIAAVRAVVAAYRGRGLKSEDSLQQAAAALDATPRRMRCLFYRDGIPIVLTDEWDRLRFRAAAVLRREADELRQRADYYDAQADALEGAQGSLWGNEWSGSNSDSRRRLAA